MCTGILSLSLACLKLHFYLNVSPSPTLTPTQNQCSYGIVLWEIAARTLPFPKVPEEKIITLVETGQRPDLSFMRHDIPAAYTQLMEDCWQQEQSARPTFAVVVRTLKEFVKQA